jgi:hypothetical protein
MNNKSSSVNLQSLMFIIGLFLFQLPYKILFAAPISTNSLHVIYKTSATRICHGSVIQINEEGNEIIKNATGTIVD